MTDTMDNVEILFVRTTNAARAYLRDHGFKEMKTKSCVVGGDL